MCIGTKWGDSSAHYARLTPWIHLCPAITPTHEQGLPVRLSGSIKEKIIIIIVTCTVLGKCEIKINNIIPNIKSEQNTVLLY